MPLASLKNRLPRWKRSKDAAQRFWEMAEAHERYLYSTAYRYTGNRFDAEDLVQEALAMALKKFEQLSDVAKFKGWIFVIMRNLYLKSHRHQGRVEIGVDEDALQYLAKLEDLDGRSDIALAYEQKVDAETVQSTLDTLHEKFKSVLILYYMEEYSYKEISEILSIPMGTVMSRLSRARVAMKKAIMRARLQQTGRDNTVSIHGMR